jgi:hypothetical protein
VLKETLYPGELPPAAALTAVSPPVPPSHLVPSPPDGSPSRRAASWSEEAVTAAYFRTQDGDEVDLVLETWDGRVAGFEVKAGSRVQDTDLIGLRLLRDRLGARFIAGFLLNLGELAYRKEERIMVEPQARTRHEVCSYRLHGGMRPHGQIVLFSWEMV